MKPICNSETELYCILGDPVTHCKSTVMHNLAFSQLDINAVFLAFLCNQDNISQVFQSVRALDIKGGSITMPVKKAAMPFMDFISKDAQLIGSVNVFKNINGRLEGYNTDGLGVVHFLQSKNIPFTDKTVLVGAGGAGQSIAIQLALHGTKNLVICDKDLASARSLADKINESITGCHADASTADESVLIAELQNSDLLVDATPLGMPPLEGQSILYSFQSIPKHVTFLDICYAPPKTKLLELARENGFQAYNGIGMLLYQGVEAFRIWTGCEFPLEYIEQQNLFANDLNP